VTKCKKGSEIPANFLSRKAFDAVGSFSDNWKLEQVQDEFHQSTKKHMHTHKNNCKCKLLEIADLCFKDRK
jgi:hypothetical protein